MHFKVILHTFMDTLRIDGDREINHHGRKIKVQSPGIEKDELFNRRTNIQGDSRIAIFFISL